MMPSFLSIHPTSPAILCIYLNLVLIFCVATKVPQIQPHRAILSVMIGDTDLRLECPIQAGGEPVIYTWKVLDMPHYQIQHNPRYQFSDNQRVLSLRGGVTKEDAGLYHCKGVTGFGRKMVNLTVEVLESKFCATSKTNDPKLKAPCFFETNMNRSPRLLERQVGSSVELNCRASGSPSPKYMWFMGKSIADWITTADGVRGPVLRIGNLRREHTGRYTCKVYNEAGALNYTYTLVVKESPAATPKILTALANRTEVAGVETSFVCQIQCECRNPIIQWLKRIEPRERQLYQDQGKKLMLLPRPRAGEIGEEYVTLEQASIQKIREGLFVTRLDLKPVSSSDQGKYIVMTMPRRGSIDKIDYQVAYIHVSKASTVPEHNNLIIYIAVPLTILIVCLGVVVYCLISRRRASSHYRGHPLPRHASSTGTNGGGGGGLLTLTSSTTVATGGKMGHLYPSSSIQSPASSQQNSMLTQFCPPPAPPGSVSTGHMTHYKYNNAGHVAPSYDHQYTPLPPTLQGGQYYYHPSATHNSSSSNGYSMHQYP